MLWGSAVNLVQPEKQEYVIQLMFMTNSLGISLRVQYFGAKRMVRQVVVNGLLLVVHFPQVFLQHSLCSQRCPVFQVYLT